MKHPDPLLPEYALGSLTPEETSEVEVHLDHCSRCREEVSRYLEVTVAMMDALTPEEPPKRVWDTIAAGLRPAPDSRTVPLSWRGAWRQRGWLGVLTVVVMAVGGLGVLYGVQYREAYHLAQVEQRRVASWLAREDVSPVPIADPDGERLGSVLLLPDGRALFVLREETEPGRTYQAWGHTGAQLVSLELSSRPVFEVSYGGFDALYLSLEPAGGSDQPTIALVELALAEPAEDW